jgi:hypothetical protein
MWGFGIIDSTVKLIVTADAWLNGPLRKTTDHTPDSPGSTAPLKNTLVLKAGEISWLARIRKSCLSVTG